jgi:predicted nucleic acid-binding protein
MNLLDTGVIIEMIREKKFIPGIISPITLIEVLRGIEDRKRSKIRLLLEESFPLLNLDSNVIETYCVIYRGLKRDSALLPDADLLIAATAIANDLMLETNDNHFHRLKQMGLKIK